MFLQGIERQFTFYIMRGQKEWTVGECVSLLNQTLCVKRFGRYDFVRAYEGVKRRWTSLIHTKVSVDKFLFSLDPDPLLHLDKRNV